MINKTKLTELRSLAEHFLDRKTRAKERLSGHVDNQLCFAVLGLRLHADEYQINEFAVLRKVVEPPGEVELASALQDKSLLSAVARYSSSIDYELAVSRSFSHQEQAVLNLSWWIVSSLRCKSRVDILVPAVSDSSWSTINGREDNSCHIYLLEDIPQARRFGEPVVVTADDLKWVGDNLTTWANLLENPSFRLAVESLTTHQQHANLRMATAALWAGFEALFAISAELRFRLATFAASYLEERGEKRHVLYSQIKKLYDYRSKAVHGAPTSDQELEEHILEIRSLLSRLVCRMAEVGSVPTVQDYEKHLFIQ